MEAKNDNNAKIKHCENKRNNQKSDSDIENKQV